MSFALVPFFALFLTLTLKPTVFDVPAARLPGFRHFGTLTCFFGPFTQSLSFLAVALPMFLTLTLKVTFLPRTTFFDFGVIFRLASLGFAGGAAVPR